MTSSDTEINLLRQRLSELETECGRLQRENANLRERLGEAPDNIPTAFPDTQVQSPHSSLSEGDKLRLFGSLFRGRQDVYPARWENQQGKAGYSPVCESEWRRPLCAKPRIKCSECKNRSLLPVTEGVLRAHLTGKSTLGIYPLLVDETCWFLAVDFDRCSWRDDVLAFLSTCDEMGVPAALERSRSGNGGHAWIFFSQAIPAVLARKLGASILTQTMSNRPDIGMESYDRLFPNQDTMPKGGFGNLIALPLQWYPRQEGNSLFVDREFQPWPDQWGYLKEIHRMSLSDVAKQVAEAESVGGVIGLPRVLSLDESEEDPWTLPPSGTRNESQVDGPLPESVNLVLANRVFVEKTSLPPAMIYKLIRTAAFQNPAFYKAQAMRLPTFGKPRVIVCAEDHPCYVSLPRGCLDKVLQLLDENGITPILDDQRNEGIPIDVEFRGELRPQQLPAVDALRQSDIGILSATTAFGKTVVAACMIAERGVNTLVLVHRRHLMEQWKERLSQFLEIDPKRIGQIGGGKRNLTGKIDVAVIQSLNKKGVVDDLVADYGQVIVDEAHHLSAVSFEQVLTQAKARYVLGLTATPVRKDGQHPIIIMQCGPIRHRVSVRQHVKESAYRHLVIPRATGFKLSALEEAPPIQLLYNQLALDGGRNELIFNDMLQVLEEGRTPLLLTERTEHLEELSERLEKFAKNVIVLRGRSGRKETTATRERIASILDDEERVLIATGRYIGEGFDDARLDTLFLALPISWRGTLQQYVGRLHRDHDNKREIRVYDYVDWDVPVLARMYEKRAKGYRSMGYETARPGADDELGLL